MLPKSSSSSNVALRHGMSKVAEAFRPPLKTWNPQSNLGRAGRGVQSRAMAEGELQGKTALVTGGARRIGREIALSLAAAGADVAITYLRSQREAGQTAQDIRGNGVRALALACDVRQEKSVREALKKVTREFGGLDLLVNNAAIYETVEV